MVNASQPSRSALRAIAAAAILIGATIVAPPAAAATFLFVNGANAACSNTGPGNESAPLCTVVAAGNRATAGTVVRVAAGTYVGQISIANAGTSINPIVFEPMPGANVTITSTGHGFVNYGKPWITIRGFHIADTGGYGIYLYYANDNTVEGNEVSGAGNPVNGQTKYGIYVKGMTNSLISDNVTHHNSDAGIYLTTDTTGVTVRGNESYGNARGYTRAAPGIDVRAPGNTIVDNVVHDNEDSGIQLYNGAHNGVIVNNAAYDNGDHGIDVLNSSGATIVGNSVFRNTTSGINVEGSSSGATIRNNISVDNALASPATRGNIRVDATSQTGTTLNHDLVFLSTSGTMITWGATQYSSLAAFRTTTGQEAAGLQADPQWSDPDDGDLHLTASSPAIDSADSGTPRQSTTDIEGNGRIDDPAVSNSGIGPRAYDDRGAFEFSPNEEPDLPPVASLAVTPATGLVPAEATADASASTDDEGIVDYIFDFGDGSIVGPQPEPVATHVYSTPGAYAVVVTVTDTGGSSSTATAGFSATPRVTDGVHYTFTGPGSVTFDWRGPDDDLRYGPTSSYGTTVTGQTPSPLPWSSAGPYWEAEITGLQPDSTYHYSIGGGPDRTFSTAPDGDYRFAVEGNIGASIVYQQVTANQQLVADGNPEFVLVAGDLSYGDQHGASSVDAHFNDVMGWSQEAAYMPAWGNHEATSGSDDMRNYKGRFSLPHAHASPGAPAQGCCGEDWGWFDAGPVRFVSYPPDFGAPALAQWEQDVEPVFQAAQADPSIKYIVTWGHRPAYTTGPNEADTLLAATLDGLGNAYSKYAVNFNAHNHAYERFEPIQGVTHITTGGGGVSLQSAWPGTDPRSVVRIIRLHHLRVDVTSAELTIDVICGPASSGDDIACTPGSVIDSVVIPAADDAPVASLEVDPDLGYVPMLVTADASGSTDTVGGGIESYEFDFGDGTIVGPGLASEVSHTFEEPGEYVVALTVTDTTGNASSDTVTVIVQPDQAPMASLVVDPTHGIAPVEVTADASASSDPDATPIESFTFDFGDGTVVGPQAGSVATHSYVTEGSYTVVVTVTDAGGSSSIASMQVDVVTNTPPDVELDVSPTSGFTPLDVTADASGSTDNGAIDSFAFDFGDGTVVGPQPGPVASHRYTTAGDFAVQVTVTDDEGSWSTVSRVVSVSDDAPPTSALAVAPASGPVPLPVVADASASTDDVGISSYTFDFGDGTVVGPQASTLASHAYVTAGTYQVTVTVTDSAGLTSSSATSVTVLPNLIANAGFESNLSGWNANGTAGATLARVSGGHSGGWAARMSVSGSSQLSSCTMNDSPNWIFTSQNGTYTASMWVRGPAGSSAQLKLRLREYAKAGGAQLSAATEQINLTTAWQHIQVSLGAATPGLSTIDLVAYTSNAPAGSVCFFADDAAIIRTT